MNFRNLLRDLRYLDWRDADNELRFRGIHTLASDDRSLLNELAEVTKSPHQDSQHHDENAQAADCDHKGNLPTGETRLFGFDSPDAQQDKQQWADKQCHLRFFGACTGRSSTPKSASSRATSSFEPILIIVIISYSMFGRTGIWMGSGQFGFAIVSILFRRQLR
jgi:hypothetical protein